MSLLGKSSPSAVVGLDIGSSTIKVVEARVGKNRINLVGMGVEPVPEGVIENGVVIDPQALGQAIKKLLSESGIKARKSVSSVGGQSSLIVRIIEMPKMTPKELTEAMKFEVERQTPFAPTEVVMDYAPVEKPSTPPDAQQMEVLLAAAQQDAVNSHIEVLFAAGLKPYAIDIEPLAEGRALIDASDNGVMNATVGIVNIGASKTDVGIYEGGLLAFPSPPLQIAGINLTRAVSEALGETVENAEILKKQFAEVDLSRINEMAADMGTAGGGDVGYGTMGQQDEEAEDFSSPINFIGAQDTGFTPGGPSASTPSPPPAAEPSAPPSGPFASPFDFGEPESGDQGASPAGFKETVDGPVFDIGGDDVDTGPVKPSFDLSDDVDTPGPIPAGPPSEEEPATPPPSEPANEPTAFRFDLNDETESPVTNLSEGTGEPRPAGEPSEPSGTGEPKPMASPFDLDEDEPKPAGPSSGTGEPRPMESPFDVSGTGEPKPGEDASGTGEPKPAESAFDVSGTGAPRPMGASDDFSSVGSTGAGETFAGGFAADASSTTQGRKQQIFEAIAPVLLELSAELRRSIEYYRNRFQNQPEKIFITGGTASIKNLDKFLTNELGIPVEVADPIRNLNVTAARYSEQYLQEVSPLFTVSIGLAIRDML